MSILNQVCAYTLLHEVTGGCMEMVHALVMKSNIFATLLKKDNRKVLIVNAKMPKNAGID